MLRSRTVIAIGCWLMMGWLAWLGGQPMSAMAASSKVLIVVSQDSPPYAEVVNGFRTALVDTGVQEGIEVYNLRGDEKNAQEFFRRFKAGPPALFLTVGSVATNVVLAEFVDVPVIASLTPHLEKLKSKGSLTGVSLEFSLQDQFEMIRHVFPESKTIGVLFSPTENQELVDAAKGLTGKLGLKLIAKPIEAPRDIPDALESAASNVDLLWGITDQVVLSPQTAEPILLFSFRNKIPFVGLSTSWVKAGALYALDRDYGDIGRQCADLAAKVLNKVNPRSLAIVAPRKMLLLINLKTARVLNVELSPRVLSSASQVFQ